jgi:site-specific DNA-methyltransferase (adenine-specific)
MEKSQVQVITDNQGLRYPKTVLQFAPDKDRSHPTQKPIALLEYLIKTYTNENDTVLDFTMGSGSTGVACKNTNRNFIGIEMDKNYFDIAKNRIESSLI